MRYIKRCRFLFSAIAGVLGEGVTAPRRCRGMAKKKLIPPSQKIRPNMMHTCRGAWRIHNIQGISSFYDFRTSTVTGFAEHLSIGRKVSGVPFFFGAHHTAGNEPARIDHASSFDGCDHELIPLFSLYPFKYFHPWRLWSEKHVFDGLGLAKLRLREARWFIASGKWKVVREKAHQYPQVRISECSCTLIASK